MVNQSGKRTKIIAAGSAEEFERRLNAELSALDSSRQRYELQFNHTLGYCAYIVIDSLMQIPETIQEEFELVGETYTCLNCPYWTHPTKGNVKYTRCPITPGLRKAQTPCCEAFYEMLYKGEIEPEHLEGREENERGLQSVR